MTYVFIEGDHNTTMGKAMLEMLKKQDRAAVLRANGKLEFTPAGLRSKNRGEEIEVTISSQ